MLTNSVARGDHRAPQALTVSPDGQHVAFIGPTEFTVTVASGSSLDEVCNMLDLCICLESVVSNESTKLILNFTIPCVKLILHFIILCVTKNCTKNDFFLQVLRIDITGIGTDAIDSALRVHYAPSSTKQLLVTTSNNRLLKFDARSGKLLTEVLFISNYEIKIFLC